MGIFSIVFASTFVGFLSGIKNIFFKSEDWKNVDTGNVAAIQSYQANSEYSSRLSQDSNGLEKDIYDYIVSNVETKKLDTLKADDFIYGDGMFDLGTGNTMNFFVDLEHMRDNFISNKNSAISYSSANVMYPVFCGEPPIERGSQLNSYDGILEANLKPWTGYSIQVLKFDNISLLFATFKNKTKYIPDFYFDKVNYRIVLRCDKDF